MNAREEAAPRTAGTDGVQRRGLGANALLMAAGVFLSRLTGLLREQSFAYLFGASAATQAFVVAFRLPNFFRDLLAENIAGAAFLPTYVDIREKRGRAASAAFLAAALALIVTGSVVIVGLGILLSPQLCAFVAPGFLADGEKFALTVDLTRLLFPFLSLISIAAFMQAIQNAENRFFMPAFSTAGLNIVFIAAGWLLSLVVNPPIVGMALGALCGGAAAVLILLPGFIAAVGRLRLARFWGNADIAAMVKLAVPVVIGVAATDVNVLVNTLMASLAEDGAIAYLNFSYRIMHLPLGLIAVSLGTASLSSLSKSHSAGNSDEYKATLSSAIAYSLRYSVPAAVLMAALSHDIVSVLYGYGKFSSWDVRMTGFALAAYAAGIPAFSVNRIFAPAFYARKEPKIPVTLGIISVCVNILFNLAALVLGAGFVGIALSASAAGFIQTGLLYVNLRDRIGGIDLKLLSRQILSVLAGIAASGIVLFVARRLEISSVHLSLLLELAAAGGAYLTVEKLFRLMMMPRR